MVIRERVARSISGCRPDVILFHQRTEVEPPQGIAPCFQIYETRASLSTLRRHEMGESGESCTRDAQGGPFKRRMWVTDTSLLIH